jgi:hypothetical protein
LVLQLVKAPLQLRQARSVVAVAASLAAPMAHALRTRASAQLPHARTRLPLQAQALCLKQNLLAAWEKQLPQAQALCLKQSLLAARTSQLLHALRRPQAQAL